MGFNRRTFLQKAGFGIAALGASETLLSLLFDGSLAIPILDRYGQALAQPTQRKLALLVGINQYPQMTALGGCVTDVEMQRELLIHRFGFNDRDILTLTDSQATRRAIETGFMEHLVNQAKAGDVVVFHFSGYGSRVKRNPTSDPNNLEKWQNSFVPVDGIVPTNGVPANDLLAETLALLLLSIASSRVATILDTSHIDRVNILQGNLRVRSTSYPPAEATNSEELAFQEQLLAQISPGKPANLNIMPGLVFAAAGLSQLAMEAKWNGFTAGLFTYALTQYLWQAIPGTTVQITMSRTAQSINQLIGINQQPKLIGEKDLDSLFTDYILSNSNIGADGVITSVDSSGTTAQLWLGGLPATVLQYYGTNSLLELVNENTSQGVGVRDELKNNEQPTTNNQQLQIRTKVGLTATAEVIASNTISNYPLQVGQLVQEVVRIIPRNVTVTIALDAKLERIERVDATSAFASIHDVSSVVVAGEQSADYLFGKRRKEGSIEDILPNSSPGYGLFYIGGEPIRNTAGESGEAVKSAVSRLVPKLKTLLASKLLRLTANEGCSRLAIRADLEMIFPQEKTIAVRETRRGFLSRQPIDLASNSPELLSDVKMGKLPSLPIGSRIQFRLENYSERPIYFMLLGFQTGANAIAFYPHPPVSPLPRADNNLPVQDGAIAPGETMTIPDPAATFDWALAGLPGLWELQLICSPFPFNQAMAKLQEGIISTVKGERIDNLFNSLDVVQGILQDLHQGSGVSSDRIGTISDSYALDVKAWATLSFIYQVV
ncbi:caspase family protein [Limnofasciculus baicalensis]|uniref:Caspase family protein n=1 Tax=Limnofasciculus baicalensis BBK-W-15 TaxID=2699891 RepID=A0AAE3KPA7_9CYAN|nr:caspase family protein [Limnofasciculus baicalensis]MCP2730711.1 caspase family protein [Limnofasciculus baicalensis BBK-W-15]